jgi:hypothetical protein
MGDAALRQWPALTATHDISRVELDADSRLPRFNMPLELGLTGSKEASGSGGGGKTGAVRRGGNLGRGAEEPYSTYGWFISLERIVRQAAYWMGRGAVNLAVMQVTGDGPPSFD